MQPGGGGEAGELFALLEGGAGSALQALFGAVRDGWLARGLLAYHTRTGSVAALDALARAPDTHARVLLDALAEQLGGDAEARRRALGALAPLVARRPAWLHRLPRHGLLSLVLHSARCEPDEGARLDALLTLAALGAHAPHALPPSPELSDALLNGAAGGPQAAIAAHALFAALYSTAPGALIASLRRELHAAGASRGTLVRALPRLVGGARLLPLLLPGAEVERLSPPPPSPAMPPPAPSPPPPGATALSARASATLRPPLEPWFSLSERCGADSAPHTPLPPEGAPVGPPGPTDSEGGSPPEAAVEATPENTPAKETRAHFTFPLESSSVRALGRLSQPPSPVRREPEGAHAARLARVLRERAAPLTPAPSPGPGPAPASPVPFGAAAPAQAARPLPRPAFPALTPTPAPLTPTPAPYSPAPVFNTQVSEDNEVLELTRGALPPPPPPPSPPRWRRPPLPRVLPPPRRASSCPPARRPRVHAAVQTVDTCPDQYKFIIHDLYRSLPEDTYQMWAHPDSASPCARLDEHLARLYEGNAYDDGCDCDRDRDRDCDCQRSLKQQLKLTHSLLMFERWRREAHAERNRRLLGRVRQTRALELSCAALRDKLRALTTDLDELRARRPVAVTAATTAIVSQDVVVELEAQLAAERLARDCAEAELHEVRRQQATDTAELQRLRGVAWEAARRGEGQARAHAAAASHAERARRRANELLLLAERERTLRRALQSACEPAAGADDAEGAVGAVGAVGAAGAALKLSREEARLAREEADAAAARAEVATARAHDLETTLAAKEATLSEVRRLARAAADEHAARLEALQDKYRALLHVQRRMELRALEPRRAPPARASPYPGPSAYPESGSCAYPEPGPSAYPEPRSDGYPEAGPSSYKDLEELAGS